MCTENVNDVPIRTIVFQENDKWVAHCLDFNLRADATEADDALDALDQAIAAHVTQAKNGQVELFQECDQALWDLYFETAKAKLLASGPGHGHVENRPLIAGHTHAHA